MQTLVAASAGEVKQVRAATVSLYAQAVLVGATCIAIGILWDISWHRTIGRDTFWTPAHMAIYFGGLLGGLICGWLVLRTTFFATAEEQAGAAGVLGVPQPPGARATSWGSLRRFAPPPVADMG